MATTFSTMKEILEGFQEYQKDISAIGKKYTKTGQDIGSGLGNIFGFLMDSSFGNKKGEYKSAFGNIGKTIGGFIGGVAGSVKEDKMYNEIIPEIKSLSKQYYRKFNRPLKDVINTSNKALEQITENEYIQKSFIDNISYTDNDDITIESFIGYFSFVYQIVGQADQAEKLLALYKDEEKLISTNIQQFLKKNINSAKNPEYKKAFITTFNLLYSNMINIDPSSVEKIDYLFENLIARCPAVSDKKSCSYSVKKYRELEMNIKNYCLGCYYETIKSKLRREEFSQFRTQKFFDSLGVNGFFSAISMQYETNYKNLGLLEKIGYKNKFCPDLTKIVIKASEKIDSELENMYLSTDSDFKEIDSIRNCIEIPVLSEQNAYTTNTESSSEDEMNNLLALQALVEEEDNKQ